MTRPRDGMALVATIAVVSLVAILGVATLSLSGRIRQESALSFRDARLNAAAAFGLGSVAVEWRARSLGVMGPGATTQFDVDVPRSSSSVTVSVTRLGGDVYWAVAEARSADGSVRRENLVLRLPIPSTAALLRDSSDVRSLGGVVVDSLASTAETTLAAGASWLAADGVTHAQGDLTVVGGSGRGILIVEGRLLISGAFTYTGVVVVRGAIEVEGPGASVAGLIRAPPLEPLPSNLIYSRLADTAKTLLATAFTPRPVAGRRWAEMY